MNLSPEVVIATIVLSVLAVIGGGIAQFVLFKIQQRKRNEPPAH